MELNHTPSESVITARMREHEVLDLIRSQFSHVVWEGDRCLCFKEGSLRLRTAFGDMSRQGDAYCVQILFIAQQPYFDEELVEPCSGVGRTPDEAIINGTLGFCDGVLKGLLHTFTHNGNETISVDLDGSTHVFCIPAERPVLHMGDKHVPPVDLWDIVKDKMPLYLGKKRAYWIDLFATANGEHPACEARINGTVYPDLTDELYKYVAAQPQAVRFSSDKQFLLLLQESATYTRCPFTKQDVGEITWKAIAAMEEITDEESMHRIYHSIREAVGDNSLGEEICCFIPEIYARQVVQYRDPDALLAVKSGGKGEIRLRKSQLASYGYIEDAVMQYRRKKRPTREQDLKIMSLSAQLRTLHTAMAEGAEVGNIRFAALAYAVSGDYKIR